ncbi:MAG: hypothetical protein HC876_10460 [Chloroflexaceae bacterium]|nr:hypothetical protein [Chloroflexaceae bacterium]NJO05899.1 hypothetical protein [Chloroflexaceae bacterium]
MAEMMTDLDLVVGSMVLLRPDEDIDEFEEQREAVSQVQDQLREKGIVVDLLAQPGIEIWEGGIETMGALYQLSRLATRIEKDASIQEVLDDGPVIYEDNLDRYVTDVWDELAQTRFPHLVNLQGTLSYYLPVDFEQPVTLPAQDANGEEDEAFFGSSVRLQRELADLKELLVQRGVSVRSQAFQCLEVLAEAAAQSLRYNMPVIVY